MLHEPLARSWGIITAAIARNSYISTRSWDGYAATFTCAHEVAHAILHPNLSTPFLRAHTRFSVGEIRK